MSKQKAPARPRQVTTAGVMGVVGSALVVLALFDSLQRLRSVEMRAAVDEFLAEPPGDGLGVSTAWVLDALHGLVLVNGALAAAAAVLAVYVFQRHHAARIGFSVVAVLLLITSPFSGGAMSMIVAFAATMLWGRPARDWFAGREPAPAVSAASEPRAPGTSEAERPEPWTMPGIRSEADADEQRAPQQTGAPSSEQPAPASYPFGSRPDPGWAPPAVGQQPGTSAGAVETQPYGDRRPASVVVAAALTWFFAGVTLFMFLVIVLMLMFGQSVLVEAVRADARFEELDVSMTDLLAVLWVGSAIAIFWSMSAVVLAVLAFRRVGWARIMLAISAGMAALFGLAGGWGGLLVLVPAGATVVLLFTGGANAWYARRPRTPGNGIPPSQPTPPFPQPNGKPPVW